jgi:hypothetical protein
MEKAVGSIPTENTNRQVRGEDKKLIKKED